MTWYKTLGVGKVTTRMDLTSARCLIWHEVSAATLEHFCWQTIHRSRVFLSGANCHCRSFCRGLHCMCGARHYHFGATMRTGIIPEWFYRLSICLKREFMCNPTLSSVLKFPNQLAVLDESDTLSRLKFKYQ